MPAHPERQPTSEWQKDLHEFSENVHSQTGEDGIIREILRRLPTTDKWCVEFGAWDGQFLSNTRQLIETGYNAVLIEADAQRFADLVHRNRANPRVVPLHGFVGFGAEDNLDRLLEPTAVPQDFDFLSIDIDGNDYYAWEATTRYRPKIVCIEFNPTIATEVRFVQPKSSRTTQGASLASLADLGRMKGYELAAVTRLNGIFVRSDLYPHLGLRNNDLSFLRRDTQDVTHIFSGYDGKIFLLGRKALPWHGIALSEQKLQLLPGWLQAYPGSYGPLKKIAFAVFLAVFHPRTFRAVLADRRRRKGPTGV